MHMRPLVSTSIRWLPALAVAWCALPTAAQRPPESEPVIKFTEPTAITVTTNQAKSADSWPSLLGLDAGVRKPFEVFNSSDSFSGARTPPPVRAAPPSAAETKRIKDALDRKKNWAFLTPEEIYGIQTPEEMMDLTEFGKDGATVEPKTSLERYLERLEKSRAPSASPANSDVLSQFDRTDGTPDDLLPADKPVLSFLADPQRQLPGVTGGEPGFHLPFNNPAVPLVKPTEGLFNIGPPVPLAGPNAKSSAQEATRKEFQQMLESRSAATFNAGIGVSAPPALAPAQPFSFGRPAPNSLNPVGTQPPTRSPLTTPATLGVAVPNFTPGYSPAPAAAMPPPPAPTPAPRLKPPSFEVPARKF